MSPLVLVLAVANRARLKLALLLMHCGAALANVDWPAAAREESGNEADRDPPEVPNAAGFGQTMTEEARRMLQDGRVRRIARNQSEDEPPLRGSARDQIESARRKAGQ